MRTKGKISSWHDEKGYGFIEPLSGGKSVFIHIKAFDHLSCRPAVNQVVTYSLATDRQGRPRAVKATLAGNDSSKKAKNSGSRLPATAAAAFLLVVGVAAITSKAPFEVLAVYLLTSLITFIAYARDKSAARKGAWRTQESTLHLLALAGGWPGALVAQQTLHHKSRKTSFRAVFWMTVVLNCGAFAWSLTPAGAASVRSLLRLTS